MRLEREVRDCRVYIVWGFGGQVRTMDLILHVLGSHWGESGQENDIISDLYFKRAAEHGQDCRRHEWEQKGSLGSDCMS